MVLEIHSLAFLWPLRMKALKVMKLCRPSSYASSKWLYHRKWEKDGGKRSGVRKEDKWCSSRIMEDWLRWSRSVPFSHALVHSFFLSIFFARSCSSIWLLLLAMPVAGYKTNFWSMISFTDFRQRDILHKLRHKSTYLTKHKSAFQNTCAHMKDQS